MTIQENTICNLIQTFPVLLILAQKQNKCLETQFVYKPPTPTQSPEYYQALDALFQNLYGHTTQPCYYSSKYGAKPCNGYNHGSHGISYGSPGISYGSHGYGIGSYGAHSPGYGSHGTGYGSPGVYFVPSYKKGNMYSANVTYGQNYASSQSYTHNRNKIVVKKTRISKRKRKSGKLQAGILSDIGNTLSGAINAVGNILQPQSNRPVSKPTRFPNPPVSIVSTIRTTVKPPEQALPSTGGEPCTAVNGGRGECVRTSICQPYTNLMRSSISNPVYTWMLREAHCGFDGNEPMSCCPLEDRTDDDTNQINPADQKPQNEVTTTLPTTTSTLPPTTSTLPPTTSTFPPTTSTLAPVMSSTLRPKPQTPDYAFLSLVGETCITVYNTTGSCKDIYLCDDFLALLKKQASPAPEVQALLKKAACGFKRGVAQVCCPLPFQSTAEMPPTTTTIPTTTRTTRTTRTTTTTPPPSERDGDFVTALPEPPFCGLSNVSLTKVVEGVPAKLGAFPWMALLGYRDPSVAAGMTWRCGGALVTNRHVLTAAHCIHNREGGLYLVRLGELDLDRDDEGATPIDVPIKTMITHELYTSNKPVIYDIGVLVLERDVQFTDLIKPICLFTAASSMFRSQTFEDYNPFVAGWGDVKYKLITASHLQVAQLPVLGPDECGQSYRNHVQTVSRELFSKQALCAGYPQGKIDSCTGDSGGPLMQPLILKDRIPRRYYMFAIGVISFGRQCGLAGWPGVFARVSYYMPWIEEKILGRAS